MKLMRIRTLLREHGFVMLLLPLIALLRLGPLFYYQLTYDEISALQRVGFDSFSGLIAGGVKIDAHPFMLQTLIWLIASYISSEAWVIKLPFVLVSLWGLLYAYKFCLRNFSVQAARIAVIIFGFSLPFVYYAPIARMYGCGVFFSLGMLYHFYEIAFNHNRARKQYVLFCVFLLLSAFNHHINALYAATVYLGGLLIIPVALRKRYLITGLVAVTMYLPHVPVTLYQLQVGGIGVEQGGWLEEPRWVAFPELLNILTGTGYGLVIMLLACGIAWYSGFKRYTLSRRLFPAVLFVVNFLVVFFYSLWRHPVYQHSVMLFASSGLVLVIASLIDTRNTKLNYVLTGTLMVWLISQTYMAKGYLQQCVKTVYEYQFERTPDYAGVAGVQGIFFDTDSVMYRIFGDKYGTGYPVSLSTSEEQKTTGDFTSFIRSLQTEVVALGSSSPLHQAITRDRYPYLLENTQTQAVHYKVYSMRDEDQHRQVPGDSLICAGSQENKGPFVFPDTRLPIEVIPSEEFPFHVKALYHDAVSAEGNVVMAEALISADEMLTDVQCCVSVTTRTQKKMIHYTAGISAEQQDGRNTFVLRAMLYAGNFHSTLIGPHTLNIYIWNRSKQPFRLHSLEVKVIDHWSPKWRFWR